MFGKVKCVSCLKSKPKSEIRYTHRNGEDLALCRECWEAAKQVFAMMRPAGNRADEARERWQRGHSG